MDTENFEEFLTVLGAMKILAESWAAVSETTIKNCFRKAKWVIPDVNLPFDDDEDDNDEDEYYRIDQNVVTSGPLNENDTQELMSFEHEETLDDLEPDDICLDNTLETENESLASASIFEFMEEIEKKMFNTQTSPTLFKLFYELKKSLSS